MFHLSLPVSDLTACVAFYVRYFDAEPVFISSDAVNLYVFDGQLTLHERDSEAFNAAVRLEMHLGAVVTSEEWDRLKSRLVELGHPLLKCTERDAAPGGRRKLVVSDPSGNLVELNADACPSAEHN